MWEVQVWIDALEPSGLRYAVGRLFTLQRVISFVSQGDASMPYGDFDIVRNSTYTLSVGR